MPRSSTTTPEKKPQPSPNVGTTWSAVYEGIGGEIDEMDPNEMGIDSPPDEVLNAFNAAKAAAAAVVASKAVGADTKVDIDLSGTASPGHTGPDVVTITITSTTIPASTEPQPVTQVLIHESTQPNVDSVSGEAVPELPVPA